jgi:hypothetical protein
VSLQGGAVLMADALQITFVDALEINFAVWGMLICGGIEAADWVSSIF